MIMTHIIYYSYRWATDYKSDAQLVETLKGLKFIPTWPSALAASLSHATPDSLGLLGEDELTLRCAAETLSWKAAGLVDALPSECRSQYFAPIFMRTEPLHELMVDLGMGSDLGREHVLRVAADIQHSSDAALSKALEAPAASLKEFQSLCHSSRRFIRYLREESRCYDLFNRPFCAKLSAIRFVPASVPVSVEGGAAVMYETRICSFSQLAAKQCGSLVFSVMPLLDDDLAFPVNLYSWLHVTTDPPVQLVLRHLKQLTEQSESLDRWNWAGAGPEQALSEVFKYLYQNWDSVSDKARQELSQASIVPVGHSLVHPSRLFFELSQDLSPFMYEMPRGLGALEAFFVLLGVRQRPSVIDYCEFLRTLAAECGDLALNPNELRAVLTIVDSIAELEGGLSSDQATALAGLYLPDELSVLRPFSRCVTCDEPWTRVALGSELHLLGVYPLHPLLPSQVVSALRVVKLSELVTEQLNEDSLKVSADSDRLGTYLHDLITNERVWTSINQLQLHSASQDRPVSIELSRSLVNSFKYVFTEALETSYALSGHQTGPHGVDMGSRSAVVYVDRSAVTAYISTAAFGPPLSLSLVLAAAVCRILDLDALTAPALAHIFATSSPSEPVQLLPAPLEGDLLSLLRIGGQPSHTTYQPGARMSRDSPDRARIELKPFRVFRAGEVVVYSAGEDDLRYGTVLGVSESTDYGLCELVVRTTSAGDTARFLSTDIYSFQSTRGKLKTSSPQAYGKSALIGPPSTQLASMSAINATPSSTSPQAQALSALSDLMARCGIHAGVDTQEMVESIVSLTASLKHAEAELRKDRSATY